MAFCEIEMELVMFSCCFGGCDNELPQYTNDENSKHPPYAPRYYYHRSSPKRKRETLIKIKYGVHTVHMPIGFDRNVRE